MSVRQIADQLEGLAPEFQENESGLGARLRLATIALTQEELQEWISTSPAPPINSSSTASGHADVEHIRVTNRNLGGHKGRSALSGLVWCAKLR